MKYIHYILLSLVVLGPGNQLAAQTGLRNGRADYTLLYATFLTEIDAFGPAFGITSDGEGNIYVAGNTRDRNYPVTDGAYQKELHGEADVFVAKFAPGGKLVFSTLIGGSKREHHTGLTVDKDGFIYLVGGTHSSDFPVTPQAFDTTFNGEKDWGGDVFLVKLDPLGSELIFSTFIGGLVQETADVVHVDSKGNVLIGGSTVSGDFPVTENAFDKEFRGFEAFLAKFSPDGRKLLFSTFLGGSDNENVSCIATDTEDNIYVAGFTRSNDLPVTGNALRKQGENRESLEWWDGTDNFLAKINEQGTRLIYSSYIGGKSRPVKSLEWYPPNKLLLAGNTASKTFPCTGNAFDGENNGDRDGFVSIFNSETMELQYSTLFGGSQYDFISGAFFIDQDRIVLGGETNSPDFPLAGQALDSDYPVSDSTYNSSFFGTRKFFISVMDLNERKLLWSSYFSGGQRFSMVPDGRGNIGYIAETGLKDFPVTDNAYRKTPSTFVLGRIGKLTR